MISCARPLRCWGGSVTRLGQAIRDAGFEIVDERLFGDYPQNPYIVASKPYKITA